MLSDSQKSFRAQHSQLASNASRCSLKLRHDFAVGPEHPVNALPGRLHPHLAFQVLPGCLTGICAQMFLQQFLCLKVA